MSDDDRRILPIEQAPSRVRREHYRRERRNSLIAITVLVTLAIVIAVLTARAVAWLR